VGVLFGFWIPKRIRLISDIQILVPVLWHSKYFGLHSRHETFPDCRLYSEICVFLSSTAYYLCIISNPIGPYIIWSWLKPLQLFHAGRAFWSLVSAHCMLCWQMSPISFGDWLWLEGLVGWGSSVHFKRASPDFNPENLPPYWCDVTRTICAYAFSRLVRYVMV
jgi:hypothetical protein